MLHSAIVRTWLHMHRLTTYRAFARGPLVMIGLGVAGSAQGQEEVVVEAAATPSPEGATVLAVDEAVPGAELGDLLQTTPGATVRGLGGLGAWSGVSLRGSSFRQVEVRIDGVPLNPDGVDAVNLSEWPLATLSEVRVFRGRVPANYGASPVGGLVDLITRASAAPPRIALSMGSFGTARASVSGGWAGQLGTAPTDGMVAADVLGTSGRFSYFTNGGTTFRTDDDATLERGNNDRYQIAAHGRWRVGSASAGWTFFDAFVHRDEGLPGPIGNPAEAARLTTTRNLLVAQGQGHAGTASLHGRLWHLARVEWLDDRLAEVGVGAAWQRDETHGVGGHLDADVLATPWMAVRMSTQARWERFVRLRLSDDVVEDPADRAVAGAALDLRMSAAQGRLTITPGVDLRGVWPVGRPELSAFAANPGLVIEGRPGRGVVLRATGGRSFRPPDMTELYGNRGAMAGNDALRPESAWQGDLSVSWATQPGAPIGVDVASAGFFRAITDRITWVQNAQRTLVPVNFGEAWIGGGELAVGVDVLGWAHARFNGTYTEAVNRTSDSAQLGKQLPFVPRVQVDHELGVHWQDYVGGGWTVHATTGVFTDAANVHRQADRLLHGLYLRGRPGPRWPTFEASVSNVGDVRTNEVARDPLGADGGTAPVPITDFVGYPLPGRTWMFGLTWTPETP